MTKFTFLLLFLLLNCSFLLSAQVKGFKTSKVKVGASFQISPFRISQITNGGALDIVGFEGRKPTWYASLFYEGGSTNKSGFKDELSRKDSFLGVKGGIGVGSVILYGTVAKHNYSYVTLLTNKSLLNTEDTSFDLGIGFKSFLGKKQGFTLGSELSTDRILGISLGFLL
jgi:hypothetical protein